MSSTYKTRLIDLIWIIGLFTLAYSLFLFSRVLFLPDDLDDLTLTSLLLNLHQLIIPHISYLVSSKQAPPLFYWIHIGVVYLLHHKAILTLRVINLGTALLGIGITYLGTAILFDRITAILSSLILGSTLIYFVVTHTISIDATLNVMMAMMIFSFFIAFEKQDKKWIYIAFALTAINALTIGMFAGLLLFSILGIWAFIFGFRPQIRHRHLYFGFLTMLVILSAIRALCAQNDPDFIQTYVQSQQLNHFAHFYYRKDHPWVQSIMILFMGFLPWSAFVFQAIVSHAKNIFRKTQDASKSSFLFSWLVVNFIYTLLTTDKLPSHMLPCFIPLAILCGQYLHHHLSETPHKGVTRGFYGLCLLSTIVLIFAIVGLRPTSARNVDAAEIALLASFILFFLGIINATIQYHRSAYFAALPRYRRLFSKQHIRFMPFASLWVTSLSAMIGLMIFSDLTINSPSIGNLDPVWAAIKASQPQELFSKKDLPSLVYYPAGTTSKPLPQPTPRITQADTRLLMQTLLSSWWLNKSETIAVDKSYYRDLLTKFPELPIRPEGENNRYVILKTEVTS